MRAKTLEQMTKAKSALIEENYIKAEFLAERCSLSKMSVYRIIRKLREEGTGIYSTPKGYILSEFASKNDDVHFLRIINGRRTGDFISLSAAKSHLEKRWNTLPDKRKLLTIVKPLMSNSHSLTRSKNLLLNGHSLRMK